MARVVLATRRSALARAQTESVAEVLRAAGFEVEVLALVTSGDRLSAVGHDPEGKGVFVKELERALLDGSADLAVHSAKDLPAELPDGLTLLAVPARADPRDVLVGARDLDALQPGARVGTGSPRRAAQVRAVRPDVKIVPMRGNVGTRLAKLDRGDADAIVLAAAGLARLGIEREDVAPLPSETCIPAPGQGFLAIEGRRDDARLAGAVGVLDDAVAHACLRAERSLLIALGGGCREPIGALCRERDGQLALTAFRAGREGDNPRRAAARGPLSHPERVGRDAAEALLAAGP